MPAHRPLTVTVSSKGWVVIPALLRKKINIHPGMKMVVSEVNRKIVLDPQPDDIVDALFGKLTGGSSLTKALLEERIEERQREKTAFCS